MNAVANPIADGYHLPVDAYTSTAWFERERKELFDQTWQFVGMSDDLVKEGDFVTSDVGASGLVILRGTDGTLNAFHNLCRHRGARLLEGTGNVGRVPSVATGRFGSQRRNPARARRLTRVFPLSMD